MGFQATQGVRLAISILKYGSPEKPRHYRQQPKSYSRIEQYSLIAKYYISSQVVCSLCDMSTLLPYQCKNTQLSQSLDELPSSWTLYQFRNRFSNSYRLRRWKRRWKQRQASQRNSVNKALTDMVMLDSDHDADSDFEFDMDDYDWHFDLHLAFWFSVWSPLRYFDVQLSTWIAPKINFCFVSLFGSCKV